MNQFKQQFSGFQNRKPKGRVLYVGHSYYHTWYLSRALRKLGWKADTLNYDSSQENQKYYHGEDFKFTYSDNKGREEHWRKFYWKAIREYDIFHFSNAHSLKFIDFDISVRNFVPQGWDIWVLKLLGKKIVYSNNGCLDGVSQSSFRKWGPEPVCDICSWRNVPTVCSDERNLAWGKFRNKMADYQITNGGNRVDYNDDPRVHDVPEFYCLDPDVWDPDLPVPDKFRLAFPQDTVKIYHAVGNFDLRTQGDKNIKSTHIYLPLIERLKAEGYPVELIFVKDIPSKDVRFYQVQADIVVDMLTYGFFGANVREAMMLGKPVVCFLRPEWLESMRREIPEYVNELPVVSATPQTVYNVLKDLIEHPEKRRELGRRGREFAVKWHSAEAGANRMDKIYSMLLGNPRFRREFFKRR